MFELDPRAITAGVTLAALDRVTSTNTEAIERARAGVRGPLWITAERQTAGRGRRGRTWTSKPGNLHATLLLTDPSPAEHWPELSFVAALAVHDAVVAAAPPVKPRLAIKWPNDLLVDSAKFGGLLIEGESIGESGAVAIGIGVNCRSHPARTDFPATDLVAAGADLSAEKLFAELSAKMLGRLAQWHGGEGFSTVRADWLARAAGLGQVVEVRLDERTLTGRFETVDESGRLVLELPEGKRQTLASGDVAGLRGQGPLQRSPPEGES
jgi:BirA family biotin operon repressor/biotin-[acetyl-CoA-carboxylase] ligase